MKEKDGEDRVFCSGVETEGGREEEEAGAEVLVRRRIRTRGSGRATRRETRRVTRRFVYRLFRGMWEINCIKAERRGPLKWKRRIFTKCIMLFNDGIFLNSCLSVPELFRGCLPDSSPKAPSIDWSDLLCTSADTHQSNIKSVAGDNLFYRVVTDPTKVKANQRPVMFDPIFLKFPE